MKTKGGNREIGVSRDRQGSAQSKRDSSTACPGASRRRKSAGHSARNDGAKQRQKQIPHTIREGADGFGMTTPAGKTPARCRRYGSSEALMEDDGGEAVAAVGYAGGGDGDGEGHGAAGAGAGAGGACES